MSFASIITNPNDPLKATRVAQAGAGLGRLARIADTIEFQPGQSMGYIAADHSGPGAEDVASILASMAVAEVTKADGNWHKGEIIGPDEGPKVAQGLNVKIVFEQADDMILVVPHADTLDYGLENAPMQEPQYLDALAVDTKRRFAAALADRAGASGDAELAERIHRLAADMIAEQHQELGDAQKEDIFFQQLGSYSVRQCD